MGTVELWRRCRSYTRNVHCKSAGLLKFNLIYGFFRCFIKLGDAGNENLKEKRREKSNHLLFHLSLESNSFLVICSINRQGLREGETRDIFHHLKFVVLSKAKNICKIKIHRPTHILSTELNTSSRYLCASPSQLCTNVKWRFQSDL